MRALNLVDLIQVAGLPLDDVVAIRHAFNKKDNKDIWDSHDKSFFEEYQSIQPSEGFFKHKKFVLAFVADGRNNSRFVGCYQVIDQYPANLAERLPGFPHMDFYDKPGHVYFNMKRTDFMKDLADRLVINWPGAIGYVQYSKSALEKKTVVSIYPDGKHSFPGYSRVTWDFVTMQDYVNHPDEYEEIENALKSVYAVYLVVDSLNGKFYVGSAYGKDGLFGRWKDYANTKGTGGNYDNRDGNKGIIEYLKDNPDAYLHFQYSILEVIHKTGINEKDVEATLEAERAWKRKLCTLNTVWGLNKNL